MQDFDERSLEGLSAEQLRQLVFLYHKAMLDLSNVNNQYTKLQQTANQCWSSQANIRFAQLHHECQAVVLGGDDAAPADRTVN